MQKPVLASSSKACAGSHDDQTDEARAHGGRPHVGAVSGSFSPAVSYMLMSRTHMYPAPLSEVAGSSYLTNQMLSGSPVGGCGGGGGSTGGGGGGGNKGGGGEHVDGVTSRQLCGHE